MYEGTEIHEFDREELGNELRRSIKSRHYLVIKKTETAVIKTPGGGNIEWIHFDVLDSSRKQKEPFQANLSAKNFFDIIQDEDVKKQLLLRYKDQIM
jgi:hypothetical protein